MITSSEIKQALEALHYLNYLKENNDPAYYGSSLQADTVNGITTLKELYKRMTESNRFDFIGGEI